MTLGTFFVRILEIDFFVRILKISLLGIFDILLIFKIF